METKKVEEGHKVTPAKPIDKNHTRRPEDEYKKEEKPPYYLHLTTRKPQKQDEESHPKEWYKRFLELFYK